MIILLLPVILVFFLVEFSFRVIISNRILKQDDRFFSRNFAMAYYFIYGNKKDTERFIRLREAYPGLTEIHTTDIPYMEKDSSLVDTLYKYYTDHDGFILPEYKNGRDNIFFVGGSTTECGLVQEQCRFNYKVGEKLASNGLKYTVRNAGFSGNNTFHSINNLVNKIFPYEPDIVVLMEAVNDLSVLLWDKTYHNDNPRRSLIVDEKSREALKKLSDARDEFVLERGTKQTVDTNIVFSKYRKALILFISICRVEGIKPVLMTQFNRIEYSNINSCTQLKDLTDKCEKYFPGTDYIALYKRMNNIMRETALKEDVLLIDLDKLVPKSNKYIYDAVHLNDTGSVYVANIISEHLMKYLQQPVVDKTTRL